MPDRILWNDNCVKSVALIQQYISESPILILPNYDIPFVVQTDASSVGIGGVLLQERDGILHPVCFCSKKLLPREQNFSVIEREALAIVFSFQKFERYLMGRQFLLLCDHKPLTCLRGTRSMRGRLSRWALLLQEYDFVYRHIPGGLNFFGDFLSRNV